MKMPLVKLLTPKLFQTCISFTKEDISKNVGKQTDAILLP